MFLNSLFKTRILHFPHWTSTLSWLLFFLPMVPPIQAPRLRTLWLPCASLPLTRSLMERSPFGRTCLKSVPTSWVPSQSSSVQPAFIGTVPGCHSARIMLLESSVFLLQLSLLQSIKRPAAGMIFQKTPLVSCSKTLKGPPNAVA